MLEDLLIEHMTPAKRAHQIDVRFRTQQACREQGDEPECWTDIGWEKLAVPRFAWADLDESHPSEAAEWSDHLIKEMQAKGAIAKNLVLTGPSGSGKTYLAWAIVRKAWKQMLKFSHTTLSDISALLRNDLPSYRQDEMEWLFTRDLLLIDDLGASGLTLSSWQSDALLRVVDDRHSRMLPILTTTNLSPDELSSVFGERTARRLLDGVTVTMTERRGSL